MEKVKRYKSAFFLSAAISVLCLQPSSFASAAEKVVVVIPMGSAIGDAKDFDVLKGKTFSSKAGKGLTGSLEIRTGSTLYTNSIGMQFSLIPAGSFVMGSPDGLNGSASDTHRPFWPDEEGASFETQHIVAISKSFYMQTTEVTQGQWEQVMGAGSNPSVFSACGMDCPVEHISWNDAKTFIQALNLKEGRSNCLSIPNSCYSLPTESQWEYAARAGTVTAFHSGNRTVTGTNCNTLDQNLDRIGWYCGNAGASTHPVAQKEPNNWGLYDMSGNVWEFCEDWFDSNYPDWPVTDPTGPANNTYRVMRGGSWHFYTGNARSASRGFDLPDNASTDDEGFRIVMPSGL